MTEPLIAVEQAETVVVVLLQVGGGWRADLEDMLPNDASTRLENESEWIVELVGDIVVLIAAEEVIDIKFGDLEQKTTFTEGADFALVDTFGLGGLG